MSDDRRQLNEQWCEFHWAPYRDPSVNGIVGATSLMQAILDDERFMKDVQKRVKKGMERNAAAQAVMDHWVQNVYRKPMCCILGDAVMDRILRTARGGAPKSH